MGNKPSLPALRKKSSSKRKPSAAALPLDAPSIETTTTSSTQQQSLSSFGAAVAPLPLDDSSSKVDQQRTHQVAALADDETAALDDNQHESDGSKNDGNDNDRQDNTNAAKEDAPTDAANIEEEEDPLQFFRRLARPVSGSTEGERESQDLFMIYTQALLLKERGDYAAASTLLRRVRNYKSLEIEAQHHLAQCLLMLDPELGCFGDEVVECLERVCSTDVANLTDTSAMQQMQCASTELLAHVLVSLGYAERARELLRTLAVDAQGNQYDEQKDIVHFQTAVCELALGDVEAAQTQLLEVDCRTSLPLVQVDAQAAERALSAAIRRQRSRTSSGIGARPAA